MREKTVILFEQLSSTRDRTAEVLRIISKSGLPSVYVDKLIEWAAYARIVRGLSPNTVGNYLHGTFNFMIWIEKEGIALFSVTAPDIGRWLQFCYVSKKDVSKTRGLNLIALRRFYAWVELEGGIINPARSIQGPKKQKRIPRKYTTDQLTRLFAAPDTAKVIGVRDYAILLFLYSTGARCNEIANLDLADIDLQQRVGTVRLLGKGSGGGKERAVMFEGPPVSALRDWLYLRDSFELTDDQAVFVGLTGKSKYMRLGKGGLLGIIKRMAKAAGIKGKNAGDLGLHKMRVTFATDLYDLGVDIETIRILMGHEDIATTREYLAITERQLKTRMPTSRMQTLLGQQKELPGYVRQKITY